MAEPHDTYKRFRNKVSDLSFEASFAASWAFSQYVQIKDFRFPNDIEKHKDFARNGLVQPYPWQLEIVIRQVVLSASQTNRRNKTMRKWDDLASIVNELRNLEEVLNETYMKEGDIFYELLRITHQQFLWQARPQTRTVGRYYRIFRDTNINAICEKLTGLPVVKIYAIGSMLWGHFTRSPFLRLPLDIKVPNISQADVSAFFNLAASDLYELRNEIGQALIIDDTFSYDNRFLRASPLISVREGGRDFIACPLPTLLFWRFTSGLYYDLTADADFFNYFGASFQRYVGDLFTRALENTSLKCIPEEKYGKKGETKDTVDWIVLDADAAAFVECKSKRLSLNAKANLVNRDALMNDVGILADAVVQLYKTINEYKAGKYPTLNFDQSRFIAPVVVTLENWYPLQHAVLIELNRLVGEKLDKVGIPQRVLTETPFVFASCDELEEAIQVIAKVGIRKFFEGRNQAKYRGWLLDGYMKDAFDAERKSAVDLFANTYDEIIRVFR